jgi:hypothetical protein
MDGGNSRQALIVRVQGGRYGRKTRYQPLDRRLDLISALEEPFDFALFAHDETLAASLDQRRVTQEKAVFGAGKAEIIDGAFVQPPESNHVTVVTKKETLCQ